MLAGLAFRSAGAWSVASFGTSDCTAVRSVADCHLASLLTAAACATSVRPDWRHSAAE